MYDPRLRARIQSTGRLGFGEDTTQILGLSEQTYIKFVRDEEVDTLSLYMTLLRVRDIDAFQVKKSGKYFYLTTARLFDSLDIDYKNYVATFNLVRTTQYDADLGGEVYRMNLELKSSKRSDNDDDADEDDDVATTSVAAGAVGVDAGTVCDSPQMPTAVDEPNDLPF